jgi:hypothetical protein
MRIRIVQFSWVFRGPRFVKPAFGQFNMSLTLRDEPRATFITIKEQSCEAAKQPEASEQLRDNDLRF